MMRPTTHPMLDSSIDCAGGDARCWRPPWRWALSSRPISGWRLQSALSALALFALLQTALCAIVVPEVANSPWVAA